MWELWTFQDSPFSMVTFIECSSPQTALHTPVMPTYTAGTGADMLHKSNLFAYLKKVAVVFGIALVFYHDSQRPQRPDSNYFMLNNRLYDKGN